jgi:glycosyltransferase involved in cell wall biosynthesis
MWSHNVSRECGADSPEAVRAKAVEETVFRAAAKVVVTTEIMRRDVASRMPAAGPKTVVIPNYVDTETFRPRDLPRDRNTILYVGRVSQEKNLHSLLQAVRDLPVRLIVIGEGKLRPELQASTDSLDGKVTWEGNVANSMLPDYMNRAGMFVLPSFYEGHPKALAEAMSCGLPVIGANSVGIREMIDHGENGYLCSTEPDGIRRAIEHLLSEPDLCATLGANARKYVEDNYSLEKICKLEAAILREAAKI